METIEDCLKKHGLRTTPSRRQVLGVLMRNTFALSQHEIEEKLPSYADRVTVYRTLLTFIKAGLVTKIASEKGLRFLLCRGERKSLNVHFKCTDCGHIEPLDNAADIASFYLPQGYITKNSDLLITGTCPDCNQLKL